MSTMFPIPRNPVLRWRADGGSLTRFVAAVSNHEQFVIDYDENGLPGYQWRLWVQQYGLKTLINAHVTKEAAIAAASLHVGDNE